MNSTWAGILFLNKFRGFDEYTFESDTLTTLEKGVKITLDTSEFLPENTDRNCMHKVQI